jgi:hypothetical protein
MKKIILISVFLFSFSFSQSLLGVRYPTGVSYPATTTSARIGSAGAGLKEPYLVNSLNPANVGAIKQSVYTLSVNADYQRVIGENDKYSDFYSFSPSFIGFAFPIGKAGTLGASFGQNGANNYSYSAESYLPETTFVTETPSETYNRIEQTQRFDNSISHSSWEFGWGMELFRRISVGASYQMSQYKNRMVRSDVLKNSAYSSLDSIYSGLDSIYYNQAGSAVSFGLLGNFSKLGVGFAMTIPFDVYIKSKRTISVLQQNSDGSYSDFPMHDNSIFDDPKKYKMKLPPSWIAGFSWEFSDKLKTMLDFNVTMWEKYKTDAPFLGYETEVLPPPEDGEQPNNAGDLANLDKLSNALRISAGTQFIPQPNLLSSKFYQKMRYSGGLSYKQLPIDGDWEMSFSVGLGLPLGNRGIVDFSLETGLRRSENYDEYKENFVRVNFGMSGGQVWKKSSNNIY